MCLLILKPAGQTITKEHFMRGFAANSHGGGFAWATGKETWYKKPFWNADVMWEDVQQYLKYPMIIHFRITTHGGHSKDNTHPHDAGGGWIMGHNGIIPNMAHFQNESDTRAYIRTVLNPLLRRHPELPLDPRFIPIVSSQIGNSKLAFLRANGDSVIVNEALGEWENGVWYSNRSYKGWRSRGTTVVYDSRGGSWIDGEYIPYEIPPYWREKGIHDNHGVRPKGKGTQRQPAYHSEMQEHYDELWGHLPTNADQDALLEQERIEYERQLDTEFFEHTRSEGIVLPNFATGETIVTEHSTFYCYMCKKHFADSICYESTFDGTCWCSHCHKENSVFV